MQLFEWGVTSKSNEISCSLRSVGITDAAHMAHIRMLDALNSVSTGQLARGWITVVTLRPDRLTYDRLELITQVTKDKHGKLRWKPDCNGLTFAAAERSDFGMVIADGELLRQIRHSRGLSREVLAWTAGLGITTLARLEGEARPRCRYQTLQRLAAVLGENPRAMTADRLPEHGN
jgi:hypothetical protein